MRPGFKTQMRADALMGRHPTGRRSVLSGTTNMPQEGGAPGGPPDATRGQMSARPNPLPPRMDGAPRPFDRGEPDGGGSPVNKGTSQPKGGPSRDFLPLRHAGLKPGGRR